MLMDQVDTLHVGRYWSEVLRSTIMQGSKCPSLPGFTHGFYPGKPGLGFKPYFEKVGT